MALFKRTACTPLNITARMPLRCTRQRKERAVLLLASGSLLFSAFRFFSLLDGRSLCCYVLSAGFWTERTACLVVA